VQALIKPSGAIATAAPDRVIGFHDMSGEAASSVANHEMIEIRSVPGSSRMTFMSSCLTT
jgi:hypothetical protein